MPNARKLSAEKLSELQANYQDVWYQTAWPPYDDFILIVPRDEHSTLRKLAFVFIMIAMLGIIAMFCSGCADRIDLVPPGQVVRLAEPVSAKVATYAGRDADGNAIWTVGANRVTLPVGYFVAPPPSTQPAK